MKKLALSLLTMFGSTYACEQLFSSMNLIKSTVRNRLGTDLCEACVQLKSTNYGPRIDSLANKIQQQNLIKNACITILYFNIPIFFIFYKLKFLTYLRVTYTFDT